MSNTFVACILVFLSLLNPLKAQWEATIKSKVDPLGPTNTSLFLKYVPIQEKTKAFHIEISFRLPRTHRTISAREMEINVRESKLFTFPFQIPPGNYEVDIDILDTEGISSTTQQMTYQSRFDKGQLSISDIFLARRPSNNFQSLSPILARVPTFSEREDSIFFYLEAYTPNLSQVSVEATLLAEKSHEQPQSDLYVSLQNASQSIQVLNGKAVFSGGFDISALNRGQYRILIRASGGIPVENTINFIIKDRIQERIKDDLLNSIAQMNYILPEERVAELLKVQPSNQWDSLISVWSHLYPNTEKLPFHTENSMESYYRRLYTFQDSLAYTGENWESDRAKIFLFYGIPDGGWEGVHKFVQGSTAYEQWAYPSENLIFTFQKQNNRYFLIE
ncbi:MAG: GWxTD domain-containing protein [Bacteroidota bacterium]